MMKLRTRPLSTTTRIKTYQVDECAARASRTRPLSTTTRIKTNQCSCHSLMMKLRTRPLSTTTRIKTYETRNGEIVHCIVLDHCPLQQGLRQITKILFFIFVKCTRPLSTTTRIKTPVFGFFLTSMRVLDHCPLQQGLRRASYPQYHSHSLVLDHCPLQQGLRHVSRNDSVAL